MLIEGKSRFSKLAESFDYEDDDSFTEKLDTLQESLITVENEIEELEESELSNDKKFLTESEGAGSPKKRYMNILQRNA